MPVQSLNWNDKIRNLAGADNLSDSQKKSLLDQYNTNISPIKNQLGYLPTYGATTNPSRSAVSVVASAYDTSGNGGRKQVRLNNGNIYVVAKDSASIYLFKSTNSGSSFSQVATTNQGTVQDVCLATNGNKVYVLANVSNANNRVYVVDDSNPLLNTNYVTVDPSQSAMGGTSITYSPSDNTLHAAWASRNATYPNSFNIRYAKGTIASDGSVTWGSVVQHTTYNTAGQDAKNPSIVVKSGNPVILFDVYNGSAYGIYSYYYNGSTWSSSAVYSVASYTQSNPSATVDGTGAIHVVWYGKDSTDTAFNNIRYSKSTDGGVTWSAMYKVTSGNTNNRHTPSITCDNNNNLYVYYTFFSAGFNQIHSIIYNGSWGTATTFANGSADIQYPSLCDNVRTFTSPLVIWQDNVSPSVKFSGTWTDTPLLSETTSISAVSNKVLIDALVSSNRITGKKFASGTVTSSAGTSSFTNSAGSSVSYNTATVNGLTFKPSTIIYYFTQSGYTIAATYSTTFPLNVLIAPQSTGFSSGGGTGAGIGFSNPIIAGGVLSVTSSGFVIPVSAASVSVSYIAFE